MGVGIVFVNSWAIISNRQQSALVLPFHIQRKDYLPTDLKCFNSSWFFIVFSIGCVALELLRNKLPAQKCRNSCILLVSQSWNHRWQSCYLAKACKDNCFWRLYRCDVYMLCTFCSTTASPRAMLGHCVLHIDAETGKSWTPCHDAITPNLGRQHVCWVLIHVLARVGYASPQAGIYSSAFHVLGSVKGGSLGWTV